MFCPQCGKEIPSEAIFCPYCRAEIHRTTASSERGNAFTASESEQSTEGQSLKSALRTNRKRPKKLLTQILIVALALALATSVAYAAYYVYTNVWLPSQQTQEQQQPAAEEPTYTVNTVTEELPSASEYEHARKALNATNWKVDYVITHEAPSVIASKLCQQCNRIRNPNDPLQGFLKRLAIGSIINAGFRGITILISG